LKVILCTIDITDLSSEIIDAGKEITVNSRQPCKSTNFHLKQSSCLKKKGGLFFVSFSSASANWAEFVMPSLFSNTMFVPISILFRTSKLRLMLQKLVYL